MDPNNTASNLLPFNNSEYSNFFWHELKRFPTLTRLYVSNLNGNNYGNLPAELVGPINDIGIFSIYNTTWIDNILAIEKLSSNTINFITEEQNLTELCNSVLEYLKPFTIKRKVVFKITSENLGKTNICTRYIKQIINNLLITIIDCLNENSEISIEIFNLNNNFEILIGSSISSFKEQNIPSDILNSPTVYMAYENLWSKHILDIQVAKLLAEQQNGKIEFEKSETQILIKFSFTSK